jgi:hypothetical protein
MSSKQTDNELFPTPEPLAALLVERLMWVATHFNGKEGELCLLEPSAGGGAFLGPMSALGAVTAVEPFESEPESLPEGVEWGAMTMEELHEALDGERPFDIICGNPPFSLAEDHLRLAFKMLRKNGAVGFLLRLGFLASKKRAKFFAAWAPKHIFVLSSRPSFMWSYACKPKKNGHEGCGHKWFEKPGIVVEACPECGKSETLQLCKTDQYDYCFIVWQMDMPPGHNTTLSHINTYGEEVPEE